MSDDSGALSIDFLVGFTIFIIAFIWVVSLVPGLLINLQGYTIDYDAVAYRTGVILVEDPGAPADPGWPVIRPRSEPWEFMTDKRDVSRLGLAISRDTPNILSENKVNRFFDRSLLNITVDYRSKSIFGDYPYRFNISLFDQEQTRSVGYGIPANTSYGYIQRFVKIKGVVTNTTISGNEPYIRSNYINTENYVTTHIFSILINNTELHETATDPLYEIDPEKEQIIINITDLESARSDQNANITLKNIFILGTVPLSTFPGIIITTNNEIQNLPKNDVKNISLKFSPLFFTTIYNLRGDIPLYVNLTFVLQPNSTFLNSSKSGPFDYNYEPENNVTQPQLRDAVLEVAIWGGETTSMVSWIITSSAIGDGKISPLGEVSVAQGASQTFTITPNIGSNITSVLVDTVPQVPIPSSYTFTNVNASHTISATFTGCGIKTINSSAGAGGSITPNGLVSVNCGDNQEFTITPNAGYVIDNVLVDYVLPQGPVASYTFFNVQVDNHKIEASFKLAPPVAAFSGTPLSGDAPLTVQFTDLSINTPTSWNWEYQNATVSWTPFSTAQNPSIPFPAGTYDIRLTATNSAGSNTKTEPGYIIVATVIHTITATAGAGGAIAPSGAVLVADGASQTFTIVPDAGYHITVVLVDGVSQGAVPTYTFNNVVAAHTISASFAIDTFTITPSVSGGNGAVSPATVQTVNYGATPTFTFAPTTGYHLNNVTVDGSLVTPTGNSYTFPAVTTNHTIVGTFAIDTFTITPSVSGGNGAVSPATVQTVNYGDTPTFTFNPDPKYHLNNVTVDGSLVTPTGNSYTFPAVTTNHTIVGTFAINTHIITVNYNNKGSVTTSPPAIPVAVPNGGTVTVNEGSSQTFYFKANTPPPNRVVTSITDNGVTVYPGPSAPGATITYTVTNVVAPHTLVVTFT